MAVFKTLRDLLKVPKKELCLCMIVSEQEGAEIWVNGEQTAFVTPRMVAIPQNEDVEIEVRLTGHETRRATVRSPQKLSYYYCNLDRVPLRLVRDEIDNRATL
ncbi:hypothetical protein DOM22_13605 [Bdellovibrio sp. ZAP7]|uniref:hypothetical protein n=1 Tax=Bdellovibrio sp. ZAP7 TaxID=2231053 RepID=UPI0011588B83|nr:hypothetical protein [Bdellovibrio sp. ZAP7]QDK46122.1 hypothetical protein DOM22_13605 [Bdellovibrio sp. ZAP7]